MAERGKGFPRLGLASAIKIVETASKFGKSWPKEQFAGFGSQNGASSAKSGAFANRVASLKDYGLITSTKDTVSLTDLSAQIAKPVTEEEREKAITKAFMNVEIFKNLFDSLESGEELSLDQVAQYAVFTLGISRESKDKFISVFIDSGRFVNLVEYNKERSAMTLAALDNDNSESVRPTPNELPEDLQMNGSEDSHPTAASVLQPAGISTATYKGPVGQFMNEQGVNYSGEGWTLTVLLKTSTRLNANTRKKVRDLIEAADELSDELRELDEGDR